MLYRRHVHYHRLHIERTTPGLSVVLGVLMITQCCPRARLHIIPHPHVHLGSYFYLWPHLRLHLKSPLTSSRTGSVLVALLVIRLLRMSGCRRTCRSGVKSRSIPKLNRSSAMSLPTLKRRDPPRPRPRSRPRNGFELFFHPDLCWVVVVVVRIRPPTTTTTTHIFVHIPVLISRTIDVPDIDVEVRSLTPQDRPTGQLRVHALFSGW